MEKFVLKQLSLLEREHEAEIESNRKYQEKLTLNELQRAGVCLVKLIVGSIRTGLYGRNVVRFECGISSVSPSSTLPSHRITCGDIVGVTLSNDRTIIASGVVLICDKSFLDVVFDGDVESIASEESSGKFNLMKLANDVTHRRLKQALNDLNKYSAHNLVELLFGEKNLRKEVKENELTVNFFNESLNDIQRESVRFALDQPEICIIHGPPGTGKTTTLIELILQCALNKQKVLACAPSNVAVDNILEKLVAANYKSVVRLGHPARAITRLQQYSLDATIANCDSFEIIKDLRDEIGEKRKSRAWDNVRSLRKELKQRERKVLKEILQNSQVVLSTLTSASPDGPLKSIVHEDAFPFDVVIIDECSQSLEAACWIVIPYAKKCVLAGDHLQLPPTIISKEAAKDGLEVTLMERLLKQWKYTDVEVMRMLCVQYRMNKNIMLWPSQHFYDSKLIAHESVENHTLNDLIPTNCDIETLLLIDTAGCDMNELELEDEESKGNEHEADIVTVYVNKLIGLGFAQTHIGIISPYNLQVELIRNRILSKYPKIEIKSVDGFQGREKEIIILSLVRSNVQNVVGFLAEERRINVAVSRAKRHLVVICDSETVTSNMMLKTLIDHMTDHGEIMSAQELHGDINELETSQRPAHLRYKNTKDNVSVRNKEKSRKKHADEMIKEESVMRNRVEEDLVLRKQIVDFIRSNETVLQFPKSLTSFARRLVHKYCESFGLEHESIGDGEERFVEIRKKQKLKVEEEAVPNIEKIELVNEEMSEDIQEGCDENKKEDDKSGKNRRRKVKQKVNKTNEKCIQTCEKEQPIVKPKENKLKPDLNLTGVDADDLDKLISVVKKSDNTCAYLRCKTNIVVLKQHCQFCARNFCLTHSMPEIHGCGDKIKAFVKSNLRKEGLFRPGSGVAAKKELAQHKRQYLEKKLSSKLSEMSNSRKNKQSSKKKEEE